MRFLLVLLLGAACGDDGGGSPGAPDAGAAPDPEPPGLEGITARHNELRASVGVGPMVWDPDLAATAQAWAEACVDAEAPAGLIDHNDGRSDGHPWYVGENIFGSSGPTAPADAVTLWFSEMADYDYDSNTCAPGAVCGHYTQVVWATSTNLGCGVHMCPLTYGYTVVCNYGPGGNDGGRPY